MKKITLSIVALLFATFSFAQINIDSLTLKSWVTTVDSVNDVTTETIRFQNELGDIITVKKKEVTVKERKALQKELITELKASKVQVIEQVKVYNREIRKWKRKLDEINAEIQAIRDNAID